MLFSHFCVGNGLREYQDVKKWSLNEQKQTVYSWQNVINVSYFIAHQLYAEDSGLMFTILWSKYLEICTVRSFTHMFPNGTSFRHKISSWIANLMFGGTWRILKVLQASYSTVASLQQENGRFYTRERIIRLDELGQTFVVRPVMRL